MVAVRADCDDDLLHFGANELLEQGPRHFQHQHRHTNLLRHFHVVGHCGIGYFIQGMATHEGRRCDWRPVRLQYRGHCRNSIERLPKHRHFAERFATNDATQKGSDCLQDPQL